MKKNCVQKELRYCTAGPLQAPSLGGYDLFDTQCKKLKQL